jgi:predicted lipoprotein
VSLFRINRNNMFKKITLFFVSVLAIYGCTSSDENEPALTDNFDRVNLLINIADNIIQPAYDDFSAKMSALKIAGEAFTDAPNQTSLEVFRSSWLSAYKIWQQIEMFDIGKAEELQYKFYMNIYPVTVNDIESNILNGSYDLNSVNNQDAQGFSALDYLIHGVADSDVAILEKYTTEVNSGNFKKYITDILNQMNDLTTQVVSDFKTQRNLFVESTQNNATSVFNKLINDYIFYYEKGLRANKFGIPAGNFSATPLPEKVEAFYRKDISKELALEAIVAVQNIFEGKHYGSSTIGIGFNDYLISLDRDNISTGIISQLSTAKAQVEKLNTNFYTQINTDNSLMTKAYDELQKVVILLKVDMLQAFNVNVDYVDADGD